MIRTVSIESASLSWPPVTNIAVHAETTGFAVRSTFSYSAVEARRGVE
jgi:hypothetical protein